MKALAYGICEKPQRFEPGPCVPVFYLYYAVMDEVLKARQLLAEAEVGLQKLVADAASQGEYESVVRIADWAKALCELVSAESPEWRPTANQIAATAPRSSDAQSDRGRRAAAKRKGYPKFFRDASSLIKVAWSKSSNSEYEHKAPWIAAQQLLAAIKRHAQKSELISMDEILPLKDKDGTEVPSYQSYLCLAWLRAEGLVRQHGRQGYSTKRGTDISQEATRAWESLPVRKRT